MIEIVTKEKFYKDSTHDPLHLAITKDLRASRVGSSAAVAVPLLPPVPTTTF
jgi:hypothetical protein